MATVGMTTTIPIEVLLAAGRRPLDLNNVFINSPDPAGLIREAEMAGYPRTACAWIKGIYATLRRRAVPEVVVVTEGDCSQTHAMMETLRHHGVRTIPFAFPYDRDVERLGREIDRLAEYFGVQREDAEEMREGLVPLRRKVAQIDSLTWQQDLVTGFENHHYQVSCSDFEGDPKSFERKVDAFLDEAKTRAPRTYRLRVGFLGVPPVYSDLYQYLAELGAYAAFNEVQRQFTMADSLEHDLLEQYRRYTYPYDIFGRLQDIAYQVRRRRLDGVIHYVQAFCFRQIQDRMIRTALDCPVLTLEGDMPGPLDSRNRLRLEAFLETLEARKATTPA